jgi:UDPglucose--hexose-1-phosphate uridylyltransferase
MNPNELLQQQPHRRLNPLTREWVLVSPHRTQRPWQGQIEPVARPASILHDPDCYLCPGNERAGGARNPAYESTFVFDNDFAALKPDTAPAAIDESGLLVARAERGICRVVCYSPNHGLTLARMDAAAIEAVVDVWAHEFAELAARPEIASVQIFENRGEMMGASNPHPHGQIWATESVPNEVDKENAAQLDWHARRGSCLLCEYTRLEREAGARTVCENGSFAVVVPYWAVWPFETMILSRRHVTGIDELNPAERSDLAALLKQITTIYDNLFEAPFPYTMGFHQRPVDGAPHPHFHFHGHFYPPLLRSAAVRKFMVGFEMLGTPQRDITAEAAAAKLNSLSRIHYLDRPGEAG